MYKSFGKRLLDLVGGGALLAVTLPLQLLIAAALWWRQGSPVLFHHQRPGREGRPFVLYKFRTMTGARDERGRLRPDAERLTPLGGWLRATSLDELPTLLNVVRGDMSLVGPRPLLTEYVPQYRPRQAARHRVRPGMTGLVQVDGRNALRWGEKFARDYWYTRNYGLCVDLWILWRTVGTVWRRGGITAADHATMPPFRGSVRKRRATDRQESDPG